MTGSVEDSRGGPSPAATRGCWLAAPAFRSYVIEGTEHGHEKDWRPGDCSALHGGSGLVLAPAGDVVQHQTPWRSRSLASWSCSPPMADAMPLRRSLHAVLLHN